MLDTNDHGDTVDRGSAGFVEPILAEVGLPTELADALDDSCLDVLLRVETDEALTLTGRDVGMPIVHFQPLAGAAFFGPVISRLPNPDDAAGLWDHFAGLAIFPGFAKLKRSLRERSQLASFGVDPDIIGVQEDWHAASRRTKKQSFPSTSGAPRMSARRLSESVTRLLSAPDGWLTRRKDRTDVEHQSYGGADPSARRVLRQHSRAGRRTPSGRSR